MKLRRLIPVLILAFAALILTKTSGQAGPANAPYPPTRVAICTSWRVFDKMAETKALRDKLEVRRKELLAKEQDYRAQIEQLVEQLKTTNPKHPKHDELLDMIDSKKAELQSWGMGTKASVDRQQKKMVKDLYDKIEAAVAEIAQKRGIDLVISDGRQDIENVAEITPEELRRMLNARNVLFATKAVDITEDVITLLDAKYAQGNPPAAGPGVPPPFPAK